MEEDGEVWDEEERELRGDARIVSEDGNKVRKEEFGK